MIIIFMCTLTACAGLGDRGDFHKRIGFFRASQLASDYLVDRNLEWGEPISTRIVEDYVVFFYAAPANISKVEGKKEGDRALYVDIHNGEVSPVAHM